MNSDLVATIGFFDGVHRGHKFLINNVIDCAKRSGGMQSAVITFDRHPRLVLHKDFQPQLLTTADEKAERLKATGVDRCFILHFDEARQHIIPVQILSYADVKNHAHVIVRRTEAVYA